MQNPITSQDRSHYLNACPRYKAQAQRIYRKGLLLVMYLPHLQVVLRPLHKIASKKVQFIWDHEAQTAYDSIILMLAKPPILVMPNNTVLFRIYCDTSKTGVGASLWQVQHGEERLLSYFSKALAKAALHYSITELELIGMYVAIHAYRYLLKSQSFEVFTDHAVIPKIMKAKTEPRTQRIKRLLERLSGYSMKVG